MKKQILFLFSILILLLFFAIYSIEKRGEKAKKPPYDEIRIVYREGQYDETNFEKTITDKSLIEEIYQEYSSMTYYQTSEPTVYPRYVLIFVKNNADVLTWHIAENNVASEENIGNYKITDKDMFLYIDNLFQNEKE